MFDSPILELLIGLVVVYLLFSLIVSAANEALASWLKTRPRMLKLGIHNLLNGQEPKPAGVDGKKEAAAEDCGSAFYAHPLIRSMCSSKNREPSYISKKTFCTVLMDIAAPGSDARGPAWKLAALHGALYPARSGEEKPVQDEPCRDGSPKCELTPSLRSALATLYEATAHQAAGAAERLAAFQGAVEGWFEEGMERVSGSYKRRTQLQIFGIAFVLAVSLNVDSVAIIHSLYQNPSLRQGLSSQATLLLKEGTGPGAAANPQNLADIKRLLEKVDVFQLPIGWTSLVSGSEIPSKLLGFLITIFAISLGAPFWFDVLNKLVSLRSTGKKEGPTPPKEAEADAAKKQGAASPTAVAVAGPGVAAVPAAALAALPAMAVTEEWVQSSIEAGLKTFDPEAASYSDQNALALGKAAVVAYKDLNVAERIVTDLWGYKTFKAFSQGTTQAFIAGNGSAIIVAFRGTEPSRLEDIIADARFSLVPRERASTGRIHSGFGDALKLVRDKMRAELSSLVPQGQQPASKKPTVWVTGHSLGAALATLFSLELEESGIPVSGLYTFGSPRVGDDAFCKAFADRLPSRAFRFVNDQDLVTRVAPRALRFQHIDRVKYFDADGRLHDDPAYWTVFLNTVINAVEDFKRTAKTMVKDHSMDLYLRKLENLAARAG